MVSEMNSNWNAWINETMKDMQENWYFSPAGTLKIYTIYFDMWENERELLKEIIFMGDNGEYAITNEHVHHTYAQAEAHAYNLADHLNIDPEKDIKILSVRHNDSDWSIAMTLENDVVVNRLGYAVFVNRSAIMEVP